MPGFFWFLLSGTILTIAGLLGEASTSGNVVTGFGMTMSIFSGVMAMDE